MQTTVLLCFALLACSYAKYLRLSRIDEHEFFGEWSRVGNDSGAQIFGSLEGNDAQLYGRYVYRHEIFNDEIFEDQAFEERSFSATGDSSVVKPMNNWNNANGKVKIYRLLVNDAQKYLGGCSGAPQTEKKHSPLSIAVWKVEKDTRLVAGSMVDKSFGHKKPQ